MAEIVLINSPVTKWSPHSSLSPPLGLAYIASSLLQEGYEVTAVDFNISGLNLRRVDRIVKRNRPVIVGISSHTETYPNALKIARRIKSVDEDVKIVMGGPHPTVLPEQVLKEESVDFVVVGEGERTMVKLARYILEGEGGLENIEGLGYKDGGELRINERGKPLDPDKLPYPARELFPLEFYRDKWTVLTSRGGCPFKCPFCAVSAIWGGSKRARDPKKIMDEVEVLIRKYGANYIYFVDDTFTLYREWVYSLLDLLNELDYSLKWGCSTRVDLVDKELLRNMAAAGCSAIQYGVESGSQRILDSVKGIKKEQVLEAVKAAKDSGMDVVCSFMIPFPEDTKETLRETKEFMKKLRRLGSRVLLSYTAPFPGTYLYEHAEELGIKILANSWDEFDAKHNVIETKYLSNRDIQKLVEEIVEEVGLKSYNYFNYF